MLQIQGVEGLQVRPGQPNYEALRKQYATSTHGVDHDMNPGLIVQPKHKSDIKRVIAYAKEQRMAIAIRSGGHQYSGASSTGAANIQLDLRHTFRSERDLLYVEKEGQNLVYASVSWSVGEFSAFLVENNMFVPHGICAHVHLGGHAQTGGYGLLGRSFGLLGDHIIELHIIDHNGEEKQVNRQNDPDMFFAWTGGSPGNLGVLTHVTFKVYRDADYNGSRALKCIQECNSSNLTRILKMIAEMNDDGDFPRNYDLCVSVLSPSFPITHAIGNLPKDKIPPGLLNEDGETSSLATIIIYAQWVPFSPSDKLDMAWFDKLGEGAIVSSGVVEKPMSKLARGWLFPSPRGFDLPYVKRTYLTASTELSTNGWVEWAAEKMERIIGTGPTWHGHRLSAQLQPFGGRHSQFRNNADNGTSYSWRDTTLCFILDDFHRPDLKQQAEKSATLTDIEARAKFSKQERRALWGSYGTFDLHPVRALYYDDEATYRRLQDARRIADPDSVFTPNTFCVKRPIRNSRQGCGMCIIQ